MADFDFDGLISFLAEAELRLLVAERDQGGGDFEAHALETGEELTELLRADALTRVTALRERELLELTEGTLLADTEAAVTDRSVLERQLVEEVLAATNRRPGAHGDPTPERIRLYTLVGADGGRTAVLLRRQNPVRHLRGGITRLLLGSRLDEAPPIFVYDGRFDVVLWDDSVLVASGNALDSLFESEDLRVQQTTEAVAALQQHVRPQDATLAAALADDRAMAAKLRKLWKSGVFEGLDRSKLQAAIDEFELDVELEDGKLVLAGNRARRWELLALIEEGFVRGAVTGRRYRANSKLGWERRMVTAVKRESGRIVALYGRGAWSPVSSEDAADDLLHRKIRYVVRTPDGTIPMTVVNQGGEDRPELGILSAAEGELLDQIPDAD